MDAKDKEFPMIKMVVFDAYGTLFDFYSIGTRSDYLYPGVGGSMNPRKHRR
jgi:FMN phosphatase YigB (HAD superfamily)